MLLVGILLDRAQLLNSITGMLMQTWHKVELPKKNLYGWADGLPRIGNHVHYREIKDWCYQNLPNHLWQSFIEGETGKKIFLFKEAKLKTFFLLRWGNDQCK